jgi:hypothetical protein
MLAALPARNAIEDATMVQMIAEVTDRLRILLVDSIACKCYMKSCWLMVVGFLILCYLLCRYEIFCFVSKFNGEEGA